MQRVRRWIAVAMLLTMPWAARAQQADHTAALAEQLRPFVECLTSRATTYALHAEAELELGAITAHLARHGDEAFSLSIEHDDYAMRLDRDADAVRLTLPKHKQIFIASGKLDSPDVLAPRGLSRRILSENTQVMAYMLMLSTGGEHGAAMLANKLLNLQYDDETWTTDKAPDAKLTFSDRPGTLTITDGEQTVRLRREDPTGSPKPVSQLTVPAGWSVTKLDRTEMEQVFTRGVKRLLEVTAPSAKLTQPQRINKQVEHGELRWVKDQRLVMLHGTPRQIGVAHGKLLKDESLACMNSVLYMFGMVNTVRSGKWFFNELREAYARLEKHIPDDHKVELDALAETIGLPREHARLGGIFPELFHCSGFAVFGSATLDGKLYHGRVLDYMTVIGLQESAATFLVDVDGKHAFMNVGYAGFIGSVTGMNEKQISLGEMGGGGVGQWDGVPMATLMRRALEECDTLDDVRRLWTESPRTCEYFYVFADGKIPDAVGVAATPDHIEFIESGQAHPRLGEGIEDTVILSAGERLSCLRGRVQDQYGKIDAAAAMQLMSRPVAMKSNLHNALFVPQDLELHASQASHDKIAAHRPYVKFDFAGLLDELRGRTASR